MSTNSQAAQQLIYGPNVLKTQNTVSTVKFLSSCFSGAVAGILGLQKWNGFGLFFATILLWTACIYTFNCKGKPAKYAQGGILELANPGQDNAATFILIWTLFYGIVHVYD